MNGTWYGKEMESELLESSGSSNDDPSGLSQQHGSAM